ncbi:MAG: SRPBCC family protein [Ilumatobacteraceae bacterium]
MDLRHEFTVAVPIADAWRILTDLERIAPCLPGAQLTEVEGDTYRGHVGVKVGPVVAQFKGQASFIERNDATYTAALKGEGRDTGGKGNASAIITASLSAESATSTRCNVHTDLTISGKVAQFGRGALADVSDKLLAQFVDNLNTLIASGGAGAPATQLPTPSTTPPSSATPSATPSSSAATPPQDTSPRQTTSTPGATPARTPSAAAPMTAPSTGSPSTATPPPSSAPATPTVRKIDGPAAEPINLLETAGSTMLKRLVPVIVVVVGVAIAAVLLL